MTIKSKQIAKLFKNYTILATEQLQSQKELKKKNGKFIRIWKGLMTYFLLLQFVQTHKLGTLCLSNHHQRRASFLDSVCESFVSLGLHNG